MDPSRRRILLDGARLVAAAAASEAGLLSPLLSAQQSERKSPAQAPIRVAGPAAARQPHSAASPKQPWLHPDRLARFADPLPVPPVLASTETRPHPHDPNQQLAYYRIVMRQVEVRVHRDLPVTRIWSYGATVPGPTIEARSGHGLLIDWVNYLPSEHFLPIDHTLHGAGADLPQVRTAVHVHGAVVPPESDGFPENWQTPGQTYQAVYPLAQDAATLWYHDHAMGIERLNQYAGLFGFFLIRDETEDALNLPQRPYEIPIAFCDRLFYEDGQLHYPDSGDPAAPWVSEVYGDVVLANGVITPFLEVEPRPYRFRFLNSANTRQFRFTLSNGQGFHQIGTDQGLLPAAAEMKELALSPAERADILIDFSSMAGKQFTLQNQSQPLMQFRVTATSTAVLRDPATATPIEAPAFLRLPKTLRRIDRIPESAAIRTRTLTLNEYMRPTTRTMLMLLDGKYWHDPVTETPVLDTVEIWNLINLTQDVHPIHLHLVRFQLLDRRAFDVDDFLNYRRFQYIGSPAPPEPGETGWKDTIQAHPETVTRIIIPFRGYPGRYVWHCHLLEHAANEMMRPFDLLPASHRD